MKHTKAELARFDRLTRMCSSLRQMDRIEGRLALKKFVAEHGKEKCEAMFAVLQKRVAKKQ